MGLGPGVLGGGAPGRCPLPRGSPQFPFGSRSSPARGCSPRLPVSPPWLSPHRCHPNEYHPTSGTPQLAPRWCHPTSTTPPVSPPRPARCCSPSEPGRGTRWPPQGGQRPWGPWPRDVPTVGWEHGVGSGVLLGGPARREPGPAGTPGAASTPWVTLSLRTPPLWDPPTPPHHPGGVTYLRPPLRSPCKLPPLRSRAGGLEGDGSRQAMARSPTAWQAGLGCFMVTSSPPQVSPNGSGCQRGGGCPGSSAPRD